MLELEKNKRVLVLAAHPDDETLGCGGTIKSLSNKGYKIELLTFTDGVSSRGENQVDRNPKLKEISNILGISKFKSGKFPDNAMDSIALLELCKFIELNAKGPYDIIFTHFAGDLNIDHQLVVKATLAAFRPQYGYKTKIYSYYVPSSTDYNPLSNFNGNSYFELSENDIQAKLDALNIYDEEMRAYPHSRSYKNILNLTQLWGNEVGLHYAEKFKLIREVI